MNQWCTQVVHSCCQQEDKDVNSEGTLAAPPSHYPPNVTTILACITINFSPNLYKLYHTVGTCLSLVSFRQCQVCGMHPCCEGARGSFLSIARVYCKNQSCVFIYSTVGGHLGCFQRLAIRILPHGGHIFWCTYGHTSVLRVGLLGQRGCICLFLIDNVQQLSKVMYQSPLPTVLSENFCCFISSPTLVWSVFKR